MAYKCGRCGKRFDEPVKIYDDPSPMGVSLARGSYVYYECPYCGDDDVIDLMFYPWLDDHKEEEEEEDEDEQ